jgi:putative ABC transport system permease protein
MRTPLAWLNFTYQKTRTVVAIAGVCFAIILVFMQLGFLGSVEATATIVYDKLRFDLMLMSPAYIELNRPGRFPRERLYQAMGVQGVDKAFPVYVAWNNWRSSEPDPRQRLKRHIMMFGIRLFDPVFRFPELEGQLALLQEPDTILIDRMSRPTLGPMQPGATTELGPLQIEIVGQFTLGLGFGPDGLIVMSDQTFVHALPGWTLDWVSLGPVQLKPGVRPEDVSARLRQVLPPDVVVLTREQVEAQERRHWVKNTSIGVIFGIGIVVSLAAGMVFVSQVISSNVRTFLGEYATLKAIGYRTRFLYRVVMQQALLLGVLGYVPALAASLVLYEVTRRLAVVPIYMTAARVVFVLLLSLGICCAAGFFSLRKVQTADPADVF